LPNLALAINNFAEELEEQQMKQEARDQEGLPGLSETEAAEGIATIHGEVLQAEPDQYLIRKYDGDVIRLRIDDKTKMRGPLRQGDRIVAKVKDQEIALTIQSAQE
jgi:hypothetical protein